MPSYYFDTSALAKRYVVEVGSSWVQEGGLILSDSPARWSPLGEAEVGFVRLVEVSQEFMGRPHIRGANTVHHPLEIVDYEVVAFNEPYISLDAETVWVDK